MLEKLFFSISKGRKEGRKEREGRKEGKEREGGKERKGGREGKRKEKKKTPCWEDIFAVVKIE